MERKRLDAYQLRGVFAYTLFSNEQEVENANAQVNEAQKAAGGDAAPASASQQQQQADALAAAAQQPAAAAAAAVAPAKPLKAPEPDQYTVSSALGVVKWFSPHTTYSTFHIAFRQEVAVFYWNALKRG